MYRYVIQFERKNKRVLNDSKIKKKCYRSAWPKNPNQVQTQQYKNNKENTVATVPTLYYVHTNKHISYMYNVICFHSYIYNNAQCVKTLTNPRFSYMFRFQNKKSGYMHNKFVI